MGYTNECHFLKISGDDGNPANAPDIIEVEPNPAARGFSPAEPPTSLPTRERGHTGTYLGHGHGLIPPSFSPYAPPLDMDTGSNNDLSGTSPDCPSNRPTPNSSATGTSDVHRQNQQSGARKSFEASPVSSHRNLSSMSGTTPSDVERNVNAFFGDPSSFTIPAGVSATGLTPDQRFTMPTGDTPAGSGGGGEFTGHATWAEMTGQQGMTPVAEGVLRSIMALGPMEGMEMGWEGS